MSIVRHLRCGPVRWPLFACTLLLAAAVIGSRVGPAWPVCGESKEAALASNLATIRQAIALYRIQHHGQPPGQAGWDELVRQLTTTTDVAGRPGGDLGPYLQPGFPANPLTGRADGRIVRAMPDRGGVVASLDDHRAWWLEGHLDPSTAIDGPGWLYSPSTGELRANVTGAGPSGTPYFEL